MPEISGRARHSCARHRFGEQGTAGPTCAARRCKDGCVNRLKLAGRLCQTPTRARRFRTEPRGCKRHRRVGWRPSEREPTSQTPYNLFGLTALCDP